MSQQKEIIYEKRIISEYLDLVPLIEESLYDLYLPIPIKLDYIKWAREYNFNINSNVTISHDKYIN